MDSANLLRNVGSQSIKGIVQLAVRKDSDLLAAIKEAVRRQHIGCGVIVSGVGALRKAVFRNLKRFPEIYPVRPEDRLYLEIEKPMELVSLGGWIATNPDEEIVIHAHFSASMVEKDSVVTLGGHLTEGTICDIKVVAAILVLADGSVWSELDPATRSYDLFIKGDEE